MVDQPINLRVVPIPLYIYNTKFFDGLYPFGMQMPSRVYQNGNGSYRYSMNGQEKSDELNPNLTTAQFWEYDGRIARRWNLDPKPTTGFSDFSVFLNNPVVIFDVLGDSPPPSPEHKYWYINKISEFKTNGNISDAPIENIPAAVGNAIIGVANLVPDLWNSGVRNLQGLREGNWIEGVKEEVGNISNTVNKVGTYPFRTPFNQWGSDFFSAADNPNTWSTVGTFWLTSKIPGGMGSAPEINQVFHSTTTTAAAENILEKSIDPSFFSSESRFGKGFYLSTSEETTIAELKNHGAQAAATIGFNLEKPVLFNSTGKLLDYATRFAPKMMGGFAKGIGFDGLIYNSVVPNTTGANIVLFKNFQKLTNATRKP